MDQIFAVSVTCCMVRLQSVRLCYDLRDRIRLIPLEDSIRKRIGRPIWFEIRFERRKTIRRSLDCMLHGACSLVLVNTSYAITTCTRNQVWIYSTLRVKSVSGILIVFLKIVDVTENKSELYRLSASAQSPATLTVVWLLAHSSYIWVAWLQ